MTYKTILLHLDEQARRSERLAIGVRLAEAFDAQLIGAFASTLPRVPAYALVEAGGEVRELDERNRREAASRAEKDFIDTARRGAVRYEWRPAAEDDGQLEFLHDTLYADLVVAGQPDPEDGAQRAFAGEVLLSCGRPLLFVPYAGSFQKLGQRVMVAWNGSRECARAVTDALPFLRRAAGVDVVTFDTGKLRRSFVEPVEGEVAAWLARHGVKVTLSRHRTGDVDVGNQILSRAADFGADLIVMGAYGHSRVRELAFGGATRALLESMTVPVLMSH